MTNVTFSSPVMARDITVYAIAGDRGTILAVAKSHNVPIPFDCQDGECGSCLVEVKHLATDKPKYGIALTEKEKEMLRQLGKITPEELYNAETNDMPPRYGWRASASFATKTFSSPSKATRFCRRKSRISRMPRKSSKAAWRSPRSTNFSATP